MKAHPVGPVAGASLAVPTCLSFSHVVVRAHHAASSADPPVALPAASCGPGVPVGVHSFVAASAPVTLWSAAAPAVGANTHAVAADAKADAPPDVAKKAEAGFPVESKTAAVAAAAIACLASIYAAAAYKSRIVFVAEAETDTLSAEVTTNTRLPAIAGVVQPKTAACVAAAKEGIANACDSPAYTAHFPHPVHGVVTAAFAVAAGSAANTAATAPGHLAADAAVSTHTRSVLVVHLNPHSQYDAEEGRHLALLSLHRPLEGSAPQLMAPCRERRETKGEAAPYLKQYTLVQNLRALQQVH